jgi:HEAT repeat protein
MRRVQAALRIRPGESPTVLRMLAVMLVGMSGAAAGANGIESLFFSRFGPHFLPYLYVALGVVTFGVMMGLSRFLSGTDAVRRLALAPLLLAGVLTTARAILLADLRWFYPALWLVMMVIWTVQLMVSWGLAGAVHDTRQAKRLFPLFGAALILGAVVGGLGTGPLAAWIGPENLILVWAGALMVITLLARPLAPRARAATRRSGTAPGRFLHETIEGLRLVRETALLRWMAVALMFFAVLYFTLALLFAEAATERFPAAAELAGFLGLFMGVANAAALVVSLLVANRLFTRFGVPAMVTALALIYLGGFAVLLFSSAFAAVVAFRLVQMVWVNGVWATGWQALFNVVPFERRSRVRSFMDGAPLQAGVVLSGGLLILAERVLSPSHLFVAGLAGATLAAISMWRARRAYTDALADALRAGNPDVFHAEEEPFGGIRRDAQAYAVVLAAASDPDPGTRRISTQILADALPPGAVEALRRALADDDPEVRAAALRGLAGAPDGMAGEIVPLLSDAEPRVRIAATQAFAAHSESSALGPRVRPLLEDPDPEVRAAAAGALLPFSDDQAERVLGIMARSPRASWRRAALFALAEAGEEPDLLIGALADADPSVRRQAVAAVGGLDPARSVDPLISALADGDAGVRGAAAEALARVGPSAVDRLLDSLARPESEAGAVEALARLPVPDSSALRSYAKEQAARATTYQQLWRGLHPGGEERLELLAQALSHAGRRHALKAIQAVAALGDPLAIELAVSNLDSPDAQQRANALESLDAAAEPQIVRPLLALWDASPGPAADGGQTILRLLGDEDPWLRACAAFAAAGLGGRGPAAVLERMARSDPDPLVREAAASASGREDGAVETLSTLSIMERVLFLRKVRLFADLAPADLKQIAEVATENAYPEGEVIAGQGETGDDMHIVVSGEIRVLLSSGAQTHEVARRRVGEYVGEMAIISEEPRMASLVCSGDVRTLSIDRKRFQRILRDRPEASLAVMRALCERLKESHAQDGIEARI